MAVSEKEVKAYIERLGQYKTERRDHEVRWKFAVQYVMPQHNLFLDQKVTDKRFDTTATQQVHRLADGLFGSNVPQAVNWFKFRFEDPELNDDKLAVEWLQHAQERVYDAIHRSNFYDVFPQHLKNGIVYGTAAMSAEEDIVAGKIVFNAIPVDEIYLCTTDKNEVYGVFRRYKLKPNQAVIAFGEDKLDPQIRHSAEKNSREDIEFLHVVERRKIRDASKKDVYNMPWASITIDLTHEKLVKESGFSERPIMAWRMEVRGNCPYGYCPTDDAMPDILTLNDMRASKMKAAEKALDPPIFFPEDSDWSMEAGAKNYYQDAGRQAYTVRPYLDFNLSLEDITDIRESIRAAYKADYFMPLMNMMDSRQMTAREIFERKQERVTVTGSMQGRLTSETINPTIARVFQIELDAGRIMAPPQTIQNTAFKIDYLSPIAQEQREVANTQGVLASLDSILPVMQIYPETKDKLVPEVIVDNILDSTGMPEKAIRSDKEYKDIQAGKAQQNAQLMQLQMQQIQADIAAKAAQAIPAGGGV